MGIYHIPPPLRSQRSIMVFVAIVLAATLELSVLSPPASAQTSWSQTANISWATAPTSAQESSGTACQSSSGTWCFSLQDNVALALSNGTGVLFQSVIQFDSSNTHNCVEDVQIYWQVGTHPGHGYSNCYSTSTGYTDSYQFSISGTVNGQTLAFSSASITDTSTNTQLSMPSGVPYPVTFSNVYSAWFHLYPFCYGALCGTTFQPSTTSSSSSTSISGLNNYGWNVESWGCTPTYCLLNYYFLHVAVVGATSVPAITTGETSNLNCYSISNDASTTKTTFNCPVWYKHEHEQGILASLPVPCQATGTCGSSSSSFSPSSQRPPLSIKQDAFVASTRSWFASPLIPPAHFLRPSPGASV